MSGKRQYNRPKGNREYRKLFVIATEGAKTEPQYFNLFNKLNLTIQVHCLKSRTASSPLLVLKRMKNHLEDNSLKKSDQAWLVIDKDQWTDEQLTQLRSWSQKAKNYDVALSNPKFEYWLLLHFESGNRIATAQECIDHLKRHLPNYKKSIDPRKITTEMINKAITQAKKRNNPSNPNWFYDRPGSTVYKLVEELIKS
jgi:uncharacterized SAM-dependent methyltransferase